MTIRKAPQAEWAREDMTFQHDLRASRLTIRFGVKFTITWWFNFFLAEIFYLWPKI